MKSYGNIVKLLTLAFVCIFLLNMLIMHVFFNTDVFNPAGREELKADITELRFDAEEITDMVAVPETAYLENTPAESEGYYQEESDNEAAQEDYNIQAAEETEGSDSTYFMTTGEVGFLENLSMLDKLEALSLISKVGREESDKIYDLAMDGITYTEMKDIGAIFKKYLDEDEMYKLTALLEKNRKQYSVAED